MKPVAVEGMVIVPVETGVSIEGFVINTPPSVNALVDGSGIYSGDIYVTVPAPTLIQGGFVAPSTVFTIHPTAKHSFVDGSAVLLEGDTSDTLTLTGTNPSGATAEFTLTMKVFVAGQSVISGE